MPESQRPVLVVSNVLLSQHGEILLGLKASNLLWATPGGKVEDETAAEAAVREQREETSMELEGTPIPMGYTEVLGADGVRYFVVHLLWSVWRGFARVAEDKFLAWRWFPLDQLPAAGNIGGGTSDLLNRLLPVYLGERAGPPAPETEEDFATIL